MKSIYFFLFLLLPFTLCARQVEWTDTDWTLEVKGSFFSPSSKKIREIYSEGWIDYQVQASKRVHYFFDVWASINWMSQIKSSKVKDYRNLKNRSKVFVLPLVLGVQFIYPILPRTDIYLGAGGCFSFLNITNHCHGYKNRGYSQATFKHHLHKTNFGAVARTGLQYALTNDLFIDLFAEYLSQRFRFAHSDKAAVRQGFNNYFNASGFKFGFGIGAYF